MNETKMKSAMDTAKQRSQTGTPTRGSTNTASDTVTALIASKRAPNTSASTSRARNMVRARFGTQTVRGTRVAGLKTAEMATEFTTM